MHLGRSVTGGASANRRLEHLYRAYGGVIYARCRRMLGDGAAAEDAAQETFLRVHRHLDRAPGGAEALAWIYRIATNYCLNEIRNRQVRARPLPDVIFPASISIEEALADRDLARRILAQVPERLRVIAWLSYVDCLSQDDVARILDISRRTVVYRIAELRKELERFVEPASQSPRKVA